MISKVERQKQTNVTFLFPVDRRKRHVFRNFDGIIKCPIPLGNLKKCLAIFTCFHMPHSIEASPFL